ncbi:Sel1 domain-containing protein [Roseibium sp. TrichSKD4]|uniref:tetratricopeptide repeat protein n=1 Tax=Roseibium sp. TrichSKD4 TaxID=744980 RepID=UPI0001E5674F|nr:tetratricopeptide repeat protein [Roseibium sp. TrichSKD4]EFO33678.1 Sel1 domain-containing protein [Roseibium sp. TrichSKD4]
MTHAVKLAGSILLLLSGMSSASAEDIDPGGTLNPDEMTLNKSLQRALEGDVDMVVCAQGYLMTKKGSHEDARKLFKTCGEKGWTGTMTWMAFMDQNGLGDAENPEQAAEWDRKAAEAGDSIGEFNYGLDLLRGYGVAQDEALGKSFIDRSAEQGLDVARDLKDSDYDWRSVTPDADEWKFQRIY